VMLACVDCVNPAMGAEALRLSMLDLPFSCAVLFSHEKPQNLPASIEWCEIWPLFDVNEYNVFMLREFHKYVDHDFVLTVQADGYVTHPERWDPTWLQYDYIGAPWPENFRCAQRNQVGNSGFCLRSKRIFELTADFATDKAIYEHRLTTSMVRNVGPVYDDVFTCSTCYSAMLASGIKYAPVSVARRFAFERPMPKSRFDKAFGFHGDKTDQTKRWCLTHNDEGHRAAAGD